MNKNDKRYARFCVDSLLEEFSKKEVRENFDKFVHFCTEDIMEDGIISPKVSFEELKTFVEKELKI